MTAATIETTSHEEELVPAWILLEFFPGVLDRVGHVTLANWLRAIGASHTADGVKVAAAIDALADDGAEGPLYRRMRQIAELIHLGNRAGWTAATVGLMQVDFAIEQ